MHTLAFSSDHWCEFVFFNARTIFCLIVNYSSVLTTLITFMTDDGDCLFLQRSALYQMLRAGWPVSSSAFRLDL